MERQPGESEYAYENVRILALFFPALRSSVGDTMVAW